MQTNAPEFHKIEVPLVEPHFDEEATLLSAQPVVPLEEVKAQQRFSRRLSFGLAILVGLVLGALGATIVYNQLAGKQAIEGNSVSEQASEQQSIPDSTIAGGVTDDLPASGSVAVQAAQPSPKVAPATPKSRSESDVIARQPEVEIEDERELRREQRREARRQRRQEARERRESRASQGAPNEDLLRIREIFEGSPRP